MRIGARQQACPSEIEHGNAPDADPSEVAVVRAARLLAECPERNWRLRDLADLVHLSTSQLGRAFSRRFGMPPMQYLARVRAHRLAQLLVETDLPIVVAMSQVGWRSRGHAARQFTAIVGVSPSAFRREEAKRVLSQRPYCRQPRRQAQDATGRDR